jgi:uncharacterized protein (AIM24 family)
MAKKTIKKKLKKQLTKEQFTVTTFTERGAVALRKAYEKVGYKLIKSEVTPDQVFLTFEDIDP